MLKVPDLRLGDCLEIMPTIPSGSVDLTVTSPPYDNLRTYNGSLNDWGEAKWKAIIAELYRVTKQGGVVVWVVGDATINGSETGTSFRQALWAIECGFRLHDTMIWRKTNPPPQVKSSRRYTAAFEYMFVWSKDAPNAFNVVETATKTAGRHHSVRGAIPSAALMAPIKSGEPRHVKTRWSRRPSLCRTSGIQPSKGRARCIRRNSPKRLPATTS